MLAGVEVVFWTFGFDADETKTQVTFFALGIDLRQE